MGPWAYEVDVVSRNASRVLWAALEAHTGRRTATPLAAQAADHVSDSGR